MKKTAVIRVYSEDGTHVGSFIRCVHNPEEWDYAYPSGSVVFCGIDTEFIRAIAKTLTIERLPI